jgi:hypothetical protein
MGSVVNFRPGGPAGNARPPRGRGGHRCGQADEVAALRAEVAALRAQLEGSRLTALAIVFQAGRDSAYRGLGLPVSSRPRFTSYDGGKRQVPPPGD